jgi:predicted NAD/FAD-binding protein
MLDFPAATFLTFFINHKLLQVNNRPIWRTVKNGSIQYVQKAAQSIARIHMNAPVQEVERRTGKVTVKTATDQAEFDRVVLATHTPVTSRILQSQTEPEKKVLGQIQYEANRALLHTDSALMPQRKRCWSSWNVFGSARPDSSSRVCLSYYLNSLQPLPTRQNYFVTLNPPREVQGLVREFNYAHPQFDQKAIQAQRDLPSLQGNGGVYFAGAWSRYGFHEDGILSAVKVAELMGVGTSWSVSS